MAELNYINLPIENLGNETKYIISNLRIGPVLKWLYHTCQRDPDYHFGVVSSIYYDTKSWDLFNEKLNSDYLKTKVRLRWYGSSIEKPAEGYAFAEVKYRIGSRRDKIRIKTHYRAEWLSKIPLESDELLKIPIFLKSRGIAIRQPIFPVFIVRYCRQRFIESISGARICLDYRIFAHRVNRMMLPTSNLTLLNTAVLEVKSTNREMPSVLNHLFALGCKKASFSKYFACLEKLTLVP